MRKVSLSAALILGSIGQAWAGPMPILPDLPPLPTTYEAVGGDTGFYAGILGGVALEPSATGTLGLLFGHTVAASDLILSLEALALATPTGSASLELDMSLGMQLSDALVVFGQAGLGADTASGMFAAAGAGIAIDVSGSVALRAQYQYIHDLSGDAAKHRFLAGAIFGF